MSFTAALHTLGSFVSELPASQLCLGAAVLGLISHHAYFIHGERDAHVWTYFLVLLGTPSMLAALLYLSTAAGLSHTVSTVTLATTSFLSAMAASIFVYRLYFHPLSRFPGPSPTRLSKLYYIHAYTQARGQYFRVQQRWHAQYGDIVRSGPNELIVLRPELLPVLGKAAKGSWYNNGNRNSSIQLVKDRETHSVRRRVWDKAFTPDAVKAYAPRVKHYTDMLLEKLAEGEREKDITAWFSYYTFDVMGAFTFGRDFGMLEKGGRDGSDYFLRMTHASMRSIALLGHTPWLLLLMEMLGAAGKEHMKFLEWCKERVDDRKRRGMGEMGSDLFEVLLEAEPKNIGPHHVPLRGDSRTAIVAGSDTTAATLIALFTYLGSSPETLSKLQAELDSLPADSTESPYLSACINEALRLNTAVPSGVSRYIPPEGVTLDDGTFLPGGVNVYFPLWVAMRDERWFDNPEEFCPERWLISTPEKLAEMKAVFQPFWIGRYQCVGRPLALAELHSVGAAVARRFDISLVGDRDAAFAKTIDTFTLEMGEIRCVFTERLL